MKHAQIVLCVVTIIFLALGLLGVGTRGVMMGIGYIAFATYFVLCAIEARQEEKTKSVVLLSLIALLGYVSGILNLIGV